MLSTGIEPATVSSLAWYSNKLCYAAAYGNWMDACVLLLRMAYLFWHLKDKKKTADLWQKRAAISLANRTKKPNHLLHVTPFSACRTAKSLRINLCLLRSSFCKTSQNKAQMQVNGLTADGTANC